MTIADRSDPAVILAMNWWRAAGGSEDDITSIDRGENGEVYLNFDGNLIVVEPRKHCVFRNLE